MSVAYFKSTSGATLAISARGWPSLSKVTAAKCWLFRGLAIGPIGIGTAKAVGQFSGREPHLTLEVNKTNE